MSFDLQKYALEGLKHPDAALQYVIGGRQALARYQVTKIAKEMQISKDLVDHYYNYINNANDFHNQIKNKLQNEYWGETGQTALHLYVLTRLLKPKYIIETGVASGVSSSYILLALADNKQGTLYSIDLPREQYYATSPDVSYVASLITADEVGFAVPEYLKNNWNLRLGYSKDILPGLLSTLGEIQMFFHDSDHSYTNMMFEFTSSWDYIKLGGMLISHDINWNQSFHDFSKNVHKKKHEIFFSNLGVIIK